MIVVRSTTDRHPGSGRPKFARTTDNIAVVQDLICSQDDELGRTDESCSMWHLLS